MSSLNSRQSSLRRILSGFTPLLGTASLVLVLTLLAAGIHAVEPLVLKHVFDALAGQDSVFAGLSIKRFLVYAVGSVLGLAVLAQGISFFANQLSWKLRLKTNYQLLDRVVSHLYGLSLRFHQRETVSSLRTRIDRGVNGFCNALFDICFTILPSLLYLSCTVVFMFALSWKLSVVALAFAPLPAIIGIWSGNIVAEREKRLTTRWVQIFERFNETLTLIKIVKSFAREEKERTRFLSEVAQTHAVVARGVTIDTLLGAAKTLSLVAGSAAVLGFGSYLILKGEITIGTLVAFLGYVGGLSAPVLGLAGVYEAVRKAKMFLDIVRELLDEAREIDDGPEARTLSAVKGAVRFEDVHFAYRADRPILQGVTFEVQPGMMVALVGPSGAGKTTVVDLLNRFYDATSGRVTIDGVDVRDVTQASLHENIAMVLQDTALFNDSLRNNIGFARDAASDEDVLAAAKAANADAFIRKLPDGYNTVVGERGACLSGGERQRIAIARAILKDAPILVFDEASSNLDSASEAVVQDAINVLRKQKTMFVIAHRLSTIKKADLILVLDKGRVVEQGTHAQLLELGGLYSELVAIQSVGK